MGLRPMMTDAKADLTCWFGSTTNSFTQGRIEFMMTDSCTLGSKAWQNSFTYFQRKNRWIGCMHMYKLSLVTWPWQSGLEADSWHHMAQPLACLILTTEHVTKDQERKHSILRFNLINCQFLFCGSDSDDSPAVTSDDMNMELFYTSSACFLGGLKGIEVILRGLRLSFTTI
jgi:hypothetical protein